MLDVVSITVYDRHTLLNIGSFVVQRKPDFEFLNAGALFTDTASEAFVWAARPRPRKRRRKRGKRAGVLVRHRRRPLRPPLPTILLANVQSLDNKICELRARISYQRETRDCCIICLTETWMSAVVPDSAIELQNNFNTSPSTRVVIVYLTTATLLSGTPTNRSPAHLSANWIILLFCSCLLIGRN